MQEGMYTGKLDQILFFSCERTAKGKQEESEKKKHRERKARGKARELESRKRKKETETHWNEINGKINHLD